ncbi:hypothetical protein CVS40_12664 [Lucilia cuprina]|nr:hypothetical protein CVS40_12664 [Lucilia cuprina]
MARNTKPQFKAIENWESNLTFSQYKFLDQGFEETVFQPMCPNQKEKVLKSYMSIFDPLGFSLPITTYWSDNALQDIWRPGIIMDDE